MVDEGVARVAKQYNRSSRTWFSRLMPVDLQSLYPKLIHLMLDTVFLVDRDNRIVFVSDACETLLGYRADELTGTLITNYMHPDDLAATRASIVRVMSGKPHIDFRNRYVRKDGGIVHILWSARWYEDEGVRIGVARDVTALTQAESELRFLAHHDPLTGLTNRSLLSDRLDSALRSARRRRSSLALLFLDVNDFKAINDVHGHAVGDHVLCEIARRLQACVRETDTVARMGGDEFTVLLTDIRSADAVSEKVEQILAAMREPLGDEFGGIKMPSCSIGVARYPEDGEDADTLLSHADTEMYRLKRRFSAVGD
jgi:diguanylate cyclase (GGDEF)-like protein/PAS domain S-box-containing protein